MDIKPWIKAFRIRTLPLAFSSVLMGSCLAIASEAFHWIVIWLSVVTTLLLQILSNLANDYGDGVKGTDNGMRLGPTRAIQSKEISPKSMRRGILLFVILCLIFGIWLIYEALGSDWLTGLLFLSLGVVSIVAAIKYTVGNNAYGYAGFGDIFVFVFFGLIAVMGTYYLNALSLNWFILFPAASMGFLSTGVLNLNNMRDIDNDRKSAKKTLASQMGIKRAMIYHVVLISGALLTALTYSFITYSSPWNFIYLITLPLFILDLRQIIKTSENEKLDPFLRNLALSTLLFSGLFGFGLIF
ncbi:MAG: 1,4-dihydroxy-2-naphthoate polyprenyltransferase [Bacteroidota bacterium]